MSSYAEPSQHPSFPFSTMPDASQMTDSQIDAANEILHDYHVAKEKGTVHEMAHGEEDKGPPRSRKNADNTQA